MATKRNLQSVYGVPLKYLALVFLVVQNSGFVLLLRYSRTTAGPHYLTSTAVVLSELLKLLVCTIMYFCEQTSNPRHEQLLPFRKTQKFFQRCRSLSIHKFVNDIFGPKSGFVKTMVPATVYTLQNNLQFVAASNLDAATFQITYQGKILTTAFFSVVLLRQQLSPRKWVSLGILTAGVALAQLPSSPAAKGEGSWVVGIAAVGVACMLSGLAGVYFEKILKGEAASIWIRNIQLSSSSVAIAAAGAMMWDGTAIKTNGFFQGYNNIVIITIVVQAFGGLIIAMVIKYADNILKGFATSVAIIVSVTVSVIIFDSVITGTFLAGAALVLLATYHYGLPDAPKEDEGQHLLGEVEKYVFLDESASTSNNLSDSHDTEK